MRIRLEIRWLRVRPPPSWQHCFVESDHEIFLTIILSLPLIQEGQFVSVWQKNVHNTVCVEVLRPSQPNGVMSSAVSLPKYTFTWQA